MNSLLNSPNYLLYLLLFSGLYLLQFTDLEFITTSEVYQQYQLNETEKRYGEDYADQFSDDLDELDYLDDDSLTFQDLLLDALFVFADTIKIPFIAFFIIMGFDLVYEISGIRYRQVLKATIIGEMVFGIQYAIHQLILVIFYETPTMEQIWNSEPLSLEGLIRSNFEISSLLDYIIPYLDAFEILYVLTIAYAIATIYKLRFRTIALYVGLFYLTSQVMIVLFELFVFEILL
jgi:hypothetical protein